ncbi:MAG: L-threonylcarbamoyladenylate synthase [Balneolaceae bacterium]|nr:L-threonylcarbamoyladenylate synthase [Balneolaceae bacterium]
MSVGMEKAVSLINSGELVAFPTETVYGLGADAWNPSAVKKIFELKQRPADNPLIVHIASLDMVEQFAGGMPGEAELLMQRFWPGPLTLIFKKKEEVLDLVTAGLDTVALRWPNNPISQELIFRAGPLVAPSANRSGRPSPTRAEHVKDDFGEDFPVIDGGSTQIGLESTVLDISDKPFVIRRPGAISCEEIEACIGAPVDKKTTSELNETAKSPGTKYSHYTPDAEVRWMDPDEAPDHSGTLYLLHSRNTETESENIIQFNGDYQQMARELYDRFRQADRAGYEAVAVENFTSEQLKQEKMAPALHNRISKAIG